MTLVVKTRANPSGQAEPIRRLVAAMDPRIPIANVKTMDEVDVVARRARTYQCGASAWGWLQRCLPAERLTCRLLGNVHVIPLGSRLQ